MFRVQNVNFGKYRNRYCEKEAIFSNFESLRTSDLKADFFEISEASKTWESQYSSALKGNFYSQKKLLF